MNKKEIKYSLDLSNLPKEKWVDVIGYDGYYQISNKGRLKSLDRITSNNRFLKSKILKIQFRKKGDVNCKYCANGVYNNFNFHKQIALHFISNYNNEPIFFIDGNRYNCKPCNFIIVTEENVIKLYNNKNIVPPNEVSEMLHEMGYKKCFCCKEIMKIKKFNKSYRNRGVNNGCIKCSKKIHQDYFEKNKEGLTDWYVREYGKLNYGYKSFTDKIIKKLRNEIIKRDEPKYFLDDLGFVTVAEFARYVKKKYGLPTTTTQKRISKGKPEKDCVLSDHDYRSKYSGTDKGQIKITDTVTNKVYLFKNTTDKLLKEMFSLYTIKNNIDTGKPTRITKASKYINPCIIERVPK